MLEGARSAEPPQKPGMTDARALSIFCEWLRVASPCARHRPVSVAHEAAGPTSSSSGWTHWDISGVARLERGTAVIYFRGFARKPWQPTMLELCPSRCPARGSLEVSREQKQWQWRMVRHAGNKNAACAPFPLLRHRGMPSFLHGKRGYPRRADFQGLGCMR